MNVLIIDDDVEDTEIFCEALTEVMPSAICTTRNSCPDIKALLASLPEQDFIFLDGHMKPLSSMQCFIALMALINTEKTKIIIHSGSLSPAEEAEFLTLGVCEIVIKAYGFFELKANLRRILIDRVQLKP